MLDKLNKSKKKEEFENLLDCGQDCEDDGNDFEEFETMEGDLEDLEIVSAEIEISENNLKQSDNGKKNKKQNNKGRKNSFFKKKKNTIKKANDFGNSKNADFVDMGDDSLVEDFVIVGDNSGKMRNFISSFKVVIGIICCILLTVLVYLSMSFKIIPEDIKGSDYSLGSFSVISRNYQPNLDELKIGDKIVCIDENFNWLPITVKYEKFTFKSRNGAIIFTEDENGKTHKIQSVDIDYVLR